MRPSTLLLLAALLMAAVPVHATEDGASAARLEEAFARLRAKVEEQRARTGAPAGDAAARLVEINRLNDRLAELERENATLQAANRQLDQELAAARDARVQLERQAQEQIRSLVRALPMLEDPAALRLELARAQARIADLEGRQP